MFPGDAFILDPDRVMEALPEYHDSLKAGSAEEAFRRWEMPTRALAYEMAALACERRLPIVVDMGCTREEELERLRHFKQEGYRLNFYYIFCPPGEAIRRTQSRERHTPPEMIRERSVTLGAVLPLYRELADQFHEFDNSDLTHPFRFFPNSIDSNTPVFPIARP